MTDKSYGTGWVSIEVQFKYVTAKAVVKAIQQKAAYIPNNRIPAIRRAK